MAKEVNLESAHDDIQIGIYRKGRFMPYGEDRTYSANLDKGSSQGAVRLAEKGRAIHGSFKDGNFRPAEVGRRGYIGQVKTPDGVRGFNYEGEIIDRQGKVVGALNVRGKLMNREEYRQELEHDVERAVTAMENMPEPQLTETHHTMQDIRERMYLDIVKIGQKVGMSQGRLDIYAKRLGVDKEKHKRNGKPRGLEKGLSAIVGLIGLGAGLALVSPNLTGNVIAEQIQNSHMILGSLLIISGLAGMFVALKKK
jgi:hypothetical protein